ncbi:MAG: AraC family transcriptional regulator [Bacteroidaceae bacterium]|nr:AraC family transcriptional regulator [Bacteroidaceae bacterium]
MKRATAKTLHDFDIERTDFSPLADWGGEALVRPDVAVVFHPGPLRARFVDTGALYRIGEWRIIFVTAGTARSVVNMQEYSLATGDVMVQPPDNIIEPLAFSPDFDVVGVAFKEQVDGLASMYLHPAASDWALCLRMARLLYELASHEPLRRAAVAHLLRALVATLQSLDAPAPTAETAGGTRAETLFHRFRRLATQHADRERTVGFYADRLCITPHYLSAVVKAASGQSVMHWVNRAAVLHAKLLLHTRRDLSVADVAYAMAFPTPSVFCKFFRRATGLTPLAYRRSAQLV